MFIFFYVYFYVKWQFKFQFFITVFLIKSAYWMSNRNVFYWLPLGYSDPLSNCQICTWLKLCEIQEYTQIDMHTLILLMALCATSQSLSLIICFHPWAVRKMGYWLIFVLTMFSNFFFYAAWIQEMNITQVSLRMGFRTRCLCATLSATCIYLMQ